MARDTDTRRRAIPQPLAAAKHLVSWANRKLDLCWPDHKARRTWIVPGSSPGNSRWPQGVRPGPTQPSDSRKGARVAQPVWSPTDDRLAYALRADLAVGDWVAYLHTLNSTAAAEPLFASPVRFLPYVWLSDDRLFGNGGTVVHLDRKPLKVDTVGNGIFFIPSPDGRWVLYSDAGGQVWLEPLPGDGKRYPVATDRADMQWLSPTEFAFRAFDAQTTRFERVTIFPSRESPVGPRRLWFEALRWADTPNLSAAVTPDGRLIYKQADLEAPVHSLRVVPNWVATMKRAVDEANK